ncbi:MAG: hypothetical protein ACR2IE_03210 [Candidatus Sumerlaeaceae bacterium]
MKQFCLLLAITMITAAAVAQTASPITAWDVQPSIAPNGTQMAGAAAVGDSLYLLGGNNTLVGDTNSVWRLRLDPTSGLITATDVVTTLPSVTFAYISSQVKATTNTATATTGTIIVAGGGYNAGGPNRNSASAINTNPDGTLAAAWTEYTFPSPYDPELGAAAIAGSSSPSGDRFFYAFGGDSQSGTPPLYDTTVFAKINKNGTLGAFSAGATLPDVDATGPTGWYFPAATAINNTIIASAGIHSAITNANASAKIYLNTVNATTGAMGAWTAGPDLPLTIYGTQLVAAGNTVFALGGRTTGGAVQSLTTRAEFNTATNTLGAWSATPDLDLPDEVYYHAAVYSDYTKRIHIVSIRRDDTTRTVSNEQWVSSRLFAQPAGPAAAADWVLFN